MYCPCNHKVIDTKTYTHEPPNGPFTRAINAIFNLLGLKWAIVTKILDTLEAFLDFCNNKLIDTKIIYISLLMDP